jgi:hypothetical protein
MIKNVFRSSCKAPVILALFRWIFKFLYRFPKDTQYRISRKSLQWQPGCSVRTDRRTKRHEANCRFSQFCKRAKLCLAITHVARVYTLKASKQRRKRLSSTVVTYTQILPQIIINIMKLFSLNIVVFLDVRVCVKNYPQCRYMVCSWLKCWLGMMRYVWSTCLLPLWCRCDIGSLQVFLPWVLCHKLGRSTFHLQQRRAEGSDPFFLWAEGVPGAEMHRRISVQYGNSVVSQRMVYEWIERFKNGRTSINHEEGARRVWRMVVMSIYSTNWTLCTTIQFVVSNARS